MVCVELVDRPTRGPTQIAIQTATVMQISLSMNLIILMIFYH